MEAKALWHNQHDDKSDDLVPLTMAAPGKEVRIIAIDGGRGIKNRLYSMGLTPGVSLRILNCGAPGPFLVAVRDFKVALGYGVAKKIIVR